MIGELAAKASDFDSLAGTEAAHVNAGRGADEDVNFAGSLVDDDDKAEGRSLMTGCVIVAVIRTIEPSVSSFTSPVATGCGCTFGPLPCAAG